MTALALSQIQRPRYYGARIRIRFFLDEMHCRFAEFVGGAYTIGHALRRRDFHVLLRELRGDPSMAQYVGSSLSDDNVEIRRAAAMALRMSIESHGNEAWRILAFVNDVLERARSDSDEIVRTEASRALSLKPL